MTAAWHAGVLSQATKIPPLREFLPKDPRPKRKQTAGEQLAIARQWHERLAAKARVRGAV